MFLLLSRSIIFIATFFKI